MPLTNYPNGITSFGIPITGNAENAGTYRKTVLWVGNTSGLPSGDGSTPDNPLSSLFGTTGALAKAHPTLGTEIHVLPGHAESISSADHASATGSAIDITIVGHGRGQNRPTFTWTAATATWLFDTAGIRIVNCILTLASSANGGVTVAAPITVSAAGCGFIGCKINFGDDADDIVTIGITTTTNANDFVFVGNKCYGATAAECTTFLRLVGVDRGVIEDNYISGATSSVSVGIVQSLTTANTDLRVKNNTFINNKALAITAVTNLATDTGTESGNSYYPPVYLPGPGDYNPPLPPGARVIFADSTAATSVRNFSALGRLFATTVQAALASCRTAAGDVVQMLPGHAESIAGADGWSNLSTFTGVTVKGPAAGPPAIITWAAADSTILMDAADFTIDGNNNTILQMEPTTGTVTVTAPITISATRNKLLNCRCMIGTDGNNKVGVAITTTTGATFLELGNLYIFGATAATCTNVITLVGAVNLNMHDVEIVAATGAVGTGLIVFSGTASTSVRMYNLKLSHMLAASETVITGMAGLTGHGDYISAYVLDNDAGNLIINDAKGAFETVASLQFGANCFVTNDIAETGAKITLVSA